MRSVLRRCSKLVIADDMREHSTASTVRYFDSSKYFRPALELDDHHGAQLVRSVSPRSIGQGARPGFPVNPLRSA